MPSERATQTHHPETQQEPRTKGGGAASTSGRPQHGRDPPAHERPAACRRHSARSSLRLVAMAAHPSSRGQALSLATASTRSLSASSTVELRGGYGLSHSIEPLRPCGSLYDAP